MAKVTLKVSTGIGKNSGKPWYMAIVSAGDYTSEPFFISKIEYAYLKETLDENAIDEALED